MDRPKKRPDYVAIPEEYFALLPEELRAQLSALRDEGLNVLASVEGLLRGLERLAHAFPSIISLKHIHQRLQSTKFEPTMDWALENDMLISAFVTTYARLVDGGRGSGVSLKDLPPELVPVHMKILELRNKRYAHNDEHDSVRAELRYEFEGDIVDVNLHFHIGFHVGGAREWTELVTFLDQLLYRRLERLLNKLTQTTCRTWVFPHNGLEAN